MKEPAIVKRAGAWLLSSTGVSHDKLMEVAFEFAKAIITQHDDIQKLTKALRATSDCLKIDPDEVQKLIDENTALHERDAEIRKRAETLMGQIQSDGGLKFEASCCNYCKETWTTMLGATREECSALARQHDLVCTRNPIVIERDHLREQLVDTQDALWKACSLATTHRPEDRQEILALGKLGRLRK